MKFLIFLITIPVYAQLDLSLPELSQEDVFDVPERKFLQFVEINEPPSRAQIITYWTLNALDVYTTYEGLKNPNIKEGNFLLNSRPSNSALITHKMIVAPLVEQNMNYYQLEFVNLMLEVAILRNLYIMQKYDAL